MSSALTLKDRLKIGVLDSGVGGLSVLRPLVKTAVSLGFSPQPCFIYLADTKRFPYGQRTQAQIQKFGAQLINWLIGKGCNVIVVACHTISTASTVKDKQPVPVFDLSDIGSWLVVPDRRTIVVLSTPATASAATISKSIAENHPQSTVLEISCPELATIIEEGPSRFDQARDVLSQYAKRIIKAQAQDVVLGCTHYPFIAGKLAEVLPAGINIIDPAIHFADYFFGQLRSGLSGKIQAKQAAISSGMQVEFYVSGSTSDFKMKLSMYAPELHGTVAPVKIEEFDEKINSSRLVLA